MNNGIIYVITTKKILLRVFMLEKASKNLTDAIIQLDLSSTGDLVDAILALKNLVDSEISSKESSSINFLYVYPNKRPLELEIAMSHTSFPMVVSLLEAAAESVMKSENNSLISNKNFNEILALLNDVKSCGMKK